VAITTSFGIANLKHFTVVTEEEFPARAARTGARS
jgi:hypothetical protein